MGANNSKPADPESELDPSTLKAILGFEPLAEFLHLFEMGIALKFVSAKLIQKVLKLTELKLSDEHRARFRALEVRKVDILREIRIFVMFIEAQVEDLKNDIEADKIRVEDIPFAELTYGSEGKTVCAVLKEYASSCMALSGDYEAFREDLEAGYYFDEATKKVLGWFGIIGGALAGLAAIFLSAGVGIPAVIGIGAAVGGGAVAVGAIVVGSFMVTDGEATRATRYLKEVAENLRKVSTNLDGIRSAYEKTNRPTVMRNIYRVLALTKEISKGIQFAIVQNFK